jgi:hypothetical protein
LAYGCTIAQHLLFGIGGMFLTAPPGHACATCPERRL